MDRKEQRRILKETLKDIQSRYDGLTRSMGFLAVLLFARNLDLISLDEYYQLDYKQPVNLKEE